MKYFPCVLLLSLFAVSCAPDMTWISNDFNNGSGTRARVVTYKPHNTHDKAEIDCTFYNRQDAEISTVAIKDVDPVPSYPHLVSFKDTKLKLVLPEKGSAEKRYKVGKPLYHLDIDSATGSYRLTPVRH